MNMLKVVNVLYCTWPGLGNVWHVVYVMYLCMRIAHVMCCILRCTQCVALVRTHWCCAQEDNKLLQSVVSQLSDADTPAGKRRDLAHFLREFCAFSQTLAQQNRDSFFKVGGLKKDCSKFGVKG